jgi:predicted RecA/RadA family phage recombinase
VQLRDFDGRLLRAISDEGPPAAIALSGQVVAVLHGRELRVYSANNGDPVWSTQLGVGTAPSLNEDRLQEGKKIYLADAAGKQVRQLTTATSDPIGLSIEGTRVAWAECAGTGSHVNWRIRAIVLRT